LNETKVFVTIIQSNQTKFSKGMRDILLVAGILVFSVGIDKDGKSCMVEDPMLRLLLLSGVDEE
jgi:hypothetical protein